ncbi:restriction endonuclease [Calothrix sp. PCC 7507]|jgi:restriction system protein|uniref:restriction endonuclease n=1 Tax=Calothrix sp. PCC 7507 TaxID=99598 RepID=UPI00029F4C65|nr:restriction endonuclease [Calothrix sp. PCC 7507]AFY32392.1 restriction endonuclease [Calothrix sp. PCC 7507]
MIPIILGAAALAGAAIYGVSELIKDGERQRQEEERQRQEKERRILASGIHEVDEMSGKDFEKLLSLLFRKTGYNVSLTPDTQDYGADLILYKDDVKTIIQAKRSKNPISVKAVQEVASAVRHYQANKAIVITNNRFTDNAYNLARSNEVELWDRKKLIEFMLRAKNY